MGRAILTVDLGFGDSGKGTIVDYLVRVYNASTVVRFNGGAQAAHTVYLPDGRHHTFSQFGSGMYVPGVTTFLSQYMLVNPLILLEEDQVLKKRGIEDALNRTFIDKRALITTPLHRAVNRLKEIARGAQRHGSCGLGIGETVEYFFCSPKLAPRVGDLLDPKILIHKLEALRFLKLHEVRQYNLPRTKQVEEELSTLMSDEVFEQMIARLLIVPLQTCLVDGKNFLKILKDGNVVFEAAQGVLLDEAYGFPPYTTWSATTFKNALALLREANFTGEIEKVGIMRTYATRHGPGPFVTESKELTKKLKDTHNKTNLWQKKFRVGYLDLVAIKYALEVVGGVDYIALTHCDKLSELTQICIDYGWKLEPSEFPDLEYQETLTKKLYETTPNYMQVTPEKTINLVQKYLATPVKILSHGPTYLDKSAL